MDGTSDLPGDFKARMEAIVKTTPDKISLVEGKRLIEAVENLESSGNRDTRELLNALNRSAGELVKLRTSELASNEKLEAAFSREVSELNGAFTDVVRALVELPALLPETDLSPVKDGLDALKTALEAKDTTPQVNVAPTEVNLDTKDLAKKMEEVKKAIESIEMPEIEIPEQQEVDMTPVVQGLADVSTRVQAVVDKRVPLPPTPHKYATNTSNHLITSPSIDYDFVDVQQTSATVDTYVFKDGGSGGTTVRTITVTYTSSGKTDIDTVAWS